MISRTRQGVGKGDVGWQNYGKKATDRQLGGHERRKKEEGEHGDEEVGRKGKAKRATTGGLNEKTSKSRVNWASTGEWGIGGMDWPENSETNGPM